MANLLRDTYKAVAPHPDFDAYEIEWEIKVEDETIVIGDNLDDFELRFNIESINDRSITAIRIDGNDQGYMLRRLIMDVLITKRPRAFVALRDKGDPPSTYNVLLLRAIARRVPALKELAAGAEIAIKLWDRSKAELVYNRYASPPIVANPNMAEITALLNEWDRLPAPVAGELLRLIPAEFAIWILHRQRMVGETLRRLPAEMDSMIAPAASYASFC